MPNYVHVYDVEDILGKYNSLVTDKRIVALEDATSLSGIDAKGKLKNVVTAGISRIRKMYSDTMNGKSYHNLFVTANVDNVLAPERDERRQNHFKSMYDAVAHHPKVQLKCGRNKNDYFAKLAISAFGDDATGLKTYYNLLYNLPLFIKDKKTNTIVNMRDNYRKCIVTRALVEQKIENLPTIARYVLHMLEDMSNNYLSASRVFYEGKLVNWTPMVSKDDLYQTYTDWYRNSDFDKKDKANKKLTIEGFCSEFLNFCPHGRNSYTMLPTSHSGMIFYTGFLEQANITAIMLSIDNWWESFDRYMPGAHMLRPRITTNPDGSFKEMSPALMSTAHSKQRFDYISSINFRGQVAPMPDIFVDQKGVPISKHLNDGTLPIMNDEEFIAKYRMRAESEHDLPVMSDDTLQSFQQRELFLNTMTEEEEDAYMNWFDTKTITKENTSIMRRVSDMLGLNLVFEDDPAYVDVFPPAKRDVDGNAKRKDLKV